MLTKYNMICTDLKLHARLATLVKKNNPTKKALHSCLGKQTGKLLLFFIKQRPTSVAFLWAPGESYLAQQVSV